jgi:transcriptional regulator with XRE-family HTH domain
MEFSVIGRSIKERRRLFGLTQSDLAHIAGVSRATMNSLERGSIGELGLSRLQGILIPLGLTLGIGEAQSMHGLKAAATTASVSLKTSLPVAVLRDALVSGVIPAAYKSHISILVDEAPIPVILAAVAETSAAAKVPAKVIWGHVKTWARALRSPRHVWS